jgi:hypothetical protein
MFSSMLSNFSNPSPLQSVRLATTAALPTCTTSGSGAGKTLTATVGAPLVVDSVTNALNDRILVKNQSTGSDDGIYTETTLGVSPVQAVFTLTSTVYSVNGSESPLAGEAITLTSPTTTYYVWFTSSGSGSAPSPGGSPTRIGPGACALLNTDTDAAAMAKVATFINTYAPSIFSVTSSTNVLTITAVASGPTTWGSGPTYVASGGYVSGVTAVNFILTRSPDFSANVLSGMQVPVTAGTVNTGKTFTLTTANPITVDTTALTFS